MKFSLDTFVESLWPHVYADDEGMVVVRGRLTPAAGAVFMQALAAARETLYQQARATEDVPAETSSTTQQQADALALLAETALHHGIAVPDDPVHTLRARNEAAGLHLHARTACPSWLGEPLDVEWAIDILHPRALRPVAASE